MTEEDAVNKLKKKLGATPPTTIEIPVTTLCGLIKGMTEATTTLKSLGTAIFTTSVNPKEYAGDLVGYATELDTWLNNVIEAL